MSDYDFKREFKKDENKNLDLKLVKLQKRFFICLQDDTNLLLLFKQFNPNRPDTRRICKVKIDRINKAVCLKSKLMQWTNTDQVLGWFIGLEEQKYSFF